MDTSYHYSVARSTTASRWAMWSSLVLIAILISVPFWAGRSDMRLISEIAYYIALAQMWNLLAGYAGLVSIGQQAFVGLGGYMLFVCSIYLGIPPLLSIVLAGFLVMLFAIPTAFIVFRLRGAYFAIGTWVMAEVYRLSFAQVSALGGGSGQSLPVKIIKSIADSKSDREMYIYFVSLLVAVIAIGIVYLLLRSRHGLALTAIRDSEEASGSLGINNFKTKFSVYLISAFGTGIAGALIFLQKLRISPDAAFSLQDWTAAVIFIVVIGGIGSVEGPIIGTLIYFLLRYFLADYGTIYMMVLGVVAVVVMLKAPTGIWGFISHKFNIHLFPVHRHLIFNEKDKGVKTQ